MSWLTPITGLILLASVIPPLLLLYFLKLRRRSTPIACTLLWKRSVEDLQANAPFQKLRRNLLLFLQILVLALLALSVAQPRLHSGVQRGGKTVMLIDRSASMTAVDAEGGRSRLEEAKAQAAERIETLYAGGLFSRSPGQTMVVAFSEAAEIMCRFTDSRQQLLAAIERIEPTHEETHIAQALKLARAYTTVVDPENPTALASERATLELYSDGRIQDLSEQVLRGESLRYYPIGAAAAENLAITSLSIERPYDRPTAVQVFVALANFAPTSVECQMQLSVDGTALAIQPLELAPAERDADSGLLVPGRNNVLFTPFEQPHGAVIEVANLRGDALAADNVAQLVVAAPKELRILLVAPVNRLIETTLEGMRLEDLVVWTDGRLYEATAEQPGGLDRFDVVVFDGYQPKAMPPGRYLAFGPPPPLEGLNPFGTAEQQAVLEWRDDHPVMRYVNLDNLYIAKFQLLEPAEDVRVLAEGTRGPVVVSVARGAMQVLYCPFDPLDSNWPFHRSWVNFLVNSIDYLGRSGGGLATRGFRPGEAITARLPPAATEIRIAPPQGPEQSSQPLDPALWSWGPARLSGVHALSWEEPGRDGRQVLPIAVNLLSDSEGDLATLDTITVGQEAVEGLSASEASYTPLWPYAVGLCLALLMLEWWVYHRKTFL